MRLYLAALGWVPDLPAGNRLRWHYPADAVDGDRYLGLPHTVIVERALLDEDIPSADQTKPSLVPGGTAAPLVPYAWWDHLGDVHPAGFLPRIYELPWPAQAVRFVYQGTGTRLLAFDRAGRVVADQKVVNGQVVGLQAPEIGALMVFAYTATFHDLVALDLFRDRRLPWEEIARIGVAASASLSLAEAALRYAVPSTMGPQEWAEFVDGATRGQDSTPAGDAANPDEPTAWAAFRVMMGTRWEHAVLFGHGFVDGPHENWPRIDRVREDLLLAMPPPRAVAYRVREERGKLEPSCVAVCPPWMAAPLTAPGQPVYERPEVRLTVDAETRSPVFRSTYNLRWTQPDPLALGVEVEEEISASPTPTIASAPVVLSYNCRTRLADDPPGEGVQVRSQDVAFHDVTLRARARAIDGWDRTSLFTAFSAWTPLELRHDPAPPNLASATWNEGSASLARQVGDPNFADWSPDLVVQHDAGARIFVYRRKTGAAGRPATAPVTVSAPVLVSGNVYRTTVAGLADVTPYDGGYLVAGAFKAMIRQVSGAEIRFEVGQGSASLFGAGSAQLQQNPLQLGLWDKVAEFSAHGLPAALVFDDPVPGPGESADVLSYHARVAYLGARVGPPGNTVQALRMPLVPVKPPPFSVDLLGVDFYNRTMVRVRFTNPVSGGSYTVWWANGAPAPSDFGSKAVPGVMRAQAPYENRDLFDVLALPLPQNASRTVTIGVQRVSAGEGQSAFETVSVVLPALAP